MAISLADEAAASRQAQQRDPRPTVGSCSTLNPHREGSRVRARPGRFHGGACTAQPWGTWGCRGAVNRSLSLSHSEEANKQTLDSGVFQAGRARVKWTLRENRGQDTALACSRPQFVIRGVCMVSGQLLLCLGCEDGGTALDTESWAMHLLRFGLAR